MPTTVNEPAHTQAVGLQGSVAMGTTKSARRKCAGAWRMGDIVGGGSLEVFDVAKIRKFGLAGGANLGGSFIR